MPVHRRSAGYRRQGAVAGLCLSAVMACGVALNPGRLRPEEPLAVIAYDSAWFLFPREADSVFGYNTTDMKYEPAPVRIWDLELAQHMSDSISEISLDQRWSRERSNSTETLAELVSHSSLTYGVDMRNCVCIAMIEDSALSVSGVDHRVRIAVRGHDAIERLLTRVGDTVTFYRYDYTGSPNDSATVKVVRPRRTGR